MISHYLILLRPKQWIKNLLVFAPLFFAGSLFDLEMLFYVSMAFLAFSFSSSLVYILNDLFDRDIDSQHPRKKERPIASGKISPKQAKLFMFFIAFIISLFFVFLPKIILPIVIYILLNGAYSAWFKHIAVLDVVVVAFFYVIRVLVGGLVVSLYLSPWIILCVLFGALFVIVSKRRSEFYQNIKRKVLEDYSKEALDFMLGVSVALALMSYGIWSVIGHPSEYLVYSVVFVLFALFKMFNRIYTHPEIAESPEVLVFKDRWILSSFVLWALCVFVLFYFKI